MSLVLTEARIRLESNKPSEEGGLTIHTLNYEIKFCGEWRDLDIQVSSKQCFDTAKKELLSRAKREWNVADDITKCIQVGNTVIEI